MLYSVFNLFIFNFFQIPSDKYVSNSSHSVLRYQPTDDGDFGLIYCWATNVMGTMDTPCSFQLIPAGSLSDFYFYFFLSIQSYDIRMYVPKPQIPSDLLIVFLTNCNWSRKPLQDGSEPFGDILFLKS